MIKEIYNSRIINIKKNLEVLFNSNNIDHQSVLLNELNKKMYDPILLEETRRYIKKRSIKIKSFKNSIDTCGTGGDGKKTLNISTSVSLVLASNGINVSKHGNKAASSDSGSTDILQEIGVKMETKEKKIHESIKKNKYAYLNAPFFYPILKNVTEVRKLLGYKTFFNLLGPTLNPLQANFQIVGAFNEKAALSIARILLRNNLKNFKVYTSKDGLDEISLFSPTVIWEKLENKIIKKIISPRKFKKYLTNKEPSFNEIKGKNPKYNARRLINLFEGKKDSYRDMVVINSIYGMMTINKKLSFEECYEKINTSINKKIQIDFLNNLLK